MWYRRQGFQDTPGSAGWGLTRHQPRHADRDHRSCVSRRVCARDQRPPRRSDAIASCICRQRVTAETVMRLLAAPCRVARPIRWKAKRSSTISRKVLLRAKLQWGRRQQATERARGKSGTILRSSAGTFERVGYCDVMGACRPCGPSGGFLFLRVFLLGSSSW